MDYRLHGNDRRGEVRGPLSIGVNWLIRLLKEEGNYEHGNKQRSSAGGVRIIPPL